MSNVNLAVVTALLVASCSSEASQPTGQSCAKTTDCYRGIDAGALHGTVTCLTNLPGGYCTHECATDNDCCAVAGECHAGIKQVCAPLESAPQTYCFVSCETADIGSSADGGGGDPNAYCAHWAGAGFTCRSTGGGSNNKRFCAH